MKFSAILSTLALAGSALAATWPGFESLPDGAYAGKVHEDGSVTVRSVTLDANNEHVYGRDYHFELQRDENDSRSPVVKKRGTTDCWTFQGELDHSGVDDAANQLRTWAGAGRNFQGHDYFGYNSGGAYVYYCVRDNIQTNVDKVDINYGLQNMDADCGAYQASYFWWPGNTAEIVGKARSGTAVCV